MYDKVLGGGLGIWEVSSGQPVHVVGMGSGVGELTSRKRHQVHKIDSQSSKQNVDLNEHIHSLQSVPECLLSIYCTM
jgi:hypothetical protein